MFYLTFKHVAYCTGISRRPKNIIKTKFVRDVAGLLYPQLCQCIIFFIFGIVRQLAHTKQ